MKKENITKEWLFEKYITENKSPKRIAQITDTSESSIRRLIKSFDLKKSPEMMQLGKQDACMEKYGTKYATQAESVKEKTTRTNSEKSPEEIAAKKEKIKNTNLERYGYENPAQVEKFQDKIKKTNMEKYGTANPLQNKDVMDKLKNTVKEKYGVEHVSQLSEVKLKKINTSLKNSGYANPGQDPKNKERSIQTNLKKRGVKFASQCKIVRNKITATAVQNGNANFIFGKTIHTWSAENKISHTNLYRFYKTNPNISEEKFIYFCKNYENRITDVENIIKNEFNLELYNKYLVPNLKYKPDFKLSDSIALNADGLYYHSELFKNNTYHHDMRKKYEFLNLRIFQFRADEIVCKLPIIKSMVNNSLNKTENKIGARKAKIQIPKTNDVKLFLEQNHIKGYKDAKHLGLYFKNELISVMSYKKGLDKDKKSFLKIERFCSKINYNVMGAFNKLLKHIKLEVGKMPIHYWVDLRYGTGNFLLKNGFKLERETLGWEWTDFKNTYNRLKCRANMDQRKLSEKEHAAELKWVKIYDAGQRLYIMNSLHEQALVPDSI